MHADWFYMKSRWLRNAKAIGPLTERELLHRIDDGSITPTTMLRSIKTRGKWVPMSSVGPALQRWLSKHPTESDD